MLLTNTDHALIDCLYYGAIYPSFAVWTVNARLGADDEAIHARLNALIAAGYVRRDGAQVALTQRGRNAFNGVVL